MNNIFAPFSITNFQGYSTESTTTSSFSLTGYTLPITPFTFIPSTNIQIIADDNPFITEPVVFSFLVSETDSGDLNFITEEIAIPTNLSNKKVVWYFGDGTYSNNLTGIHVYTKPGIYNITNVYFDASGYSYQNTYSLQLTVYNFIPDALVPSISSGYISSGQYVLTAGKITTPFEVIRTTSWQNEYILSASPTYRLYSLSGTENYFDQKLTTNKYGHLYPYSSFYDVQSGELVEIENFTTSNVLLYCKLSGTNIVQTSQTDINSVFCGASGSKMLYFKDDLPRTNVNLYVIPYDINADVNQVPIGIKSTIVPNTALSALAISSNGVTGEGVRNNTFDINNIKFVNEKINFVVSIKDNNWFTVAKDTNLILGNTSLTNRISVYPINSQGTPVHNIGTITSNFSYLSSVSGGFFRGLFTPSLTASNIRLKVDGLSLSGVSSTFNIYPSAGQYSIAKINEDFDFTNQLKQLRYQEFLQDYNVLFDDFFGSIFGNLSSDPTSMGKLPYEKIANFVSNKHSVDKCDVDSLFSMSYEIASDFTKFEKNNFNYPAKLKRYIDIFSINHSRLWGAKNQWNLNFDNKFGADSTKYGINFGEKLDFYTTVLTAADGYIIAYEKFSSTFKLCNTYITTISTTLLNPSLSTYSLSSYNDTWGWNLVLGNNISGGEILKYYDFYRYNSAIDGTVLDSVINFNDILTTLNYTNSSYDEWVNDSGFIDNILSNILYTSINLLST
jgi:hypothetical protein